MHVWLITIGEPLPLPGHDVRLLRTGRLIQPLTERGHSVTWWSSDFEHSAKRYVRAREHDGALGTQARLVLLHGRGYRRNLSLNRLLNHWELGRDFRRRASGYPRPDIILCSLPTLELADAAVRYGTAARVPVVLDVRDLWPDIFSNAVPAPLRPVARAMLQPYLRMAHRALAGATGIIGISDNYLAWALKVAGRDQHGGDAVVPLGYEALDPAPGPDHGPAVAELRARGVDPSRRLVWFIGSFGRTYDLLPVIGAARLLAAAGRRDVQFVLSGAGEREAGWRRAAADLPNVVFTGWLRRSQIHAMMRLAHVGLAAYAPGAPQGLPNKLFEYLSAGLPIVSSLDGEAAELLDHLQCGCSYPARDSGALARILADMLDDPAWHGAMAGRARAAFAERYSAARIDTALIGHLEGTLHDGAAGNRAAR